MNTINEFDFELLKSIKYKINILLSSSSNKSNRDKNLLNKSDSSIHVLFFPVIPKKGALIIFFLILKDVSLDLLLTILK